ncbi:MAG: 2-phospho-L-lactate/phosphoenolpyruvate guanylyltransferase [Pseudonocardiales bacterium]|nr:2-phospho-L-lactate/phosphoenolpyruvate guanylyltransferase [Pseudonocardiales bacterium]
MRAESEWTVVLAVKPLRTAKSRMDGWLSASQRAELVLAMTRDVLLAARGCTAVSRLIVVTPDPQIAQVALEASALVLPETRATGLNAAYRRGRDMVVAEGDGPLTLLMADLAFIRPHDLALALEAVPPNGSAVVRDAAGQGTTMLAARRASEVVPQFGGRSFARHLAGGAVDITAHAETGLRADVDDVSAFSTPPSALAGSATRQWFRRLAASRVSPEPIQPQTSHEIGYRTA